MSNLPESSDWTPGVYQIESSDPVVGGPDGVTNLPTKQLTNRTLWLKQRIEALINGPLSAATAINLVRPRHDSRQLSDYGVAFATQAEAETGADTNKPMSALRVLQTLRAKVVQATERTAGIAHIASSLMVRTGNDNQAIVTPQTLAAQFPYRGVKIYSNAGVFIWNVPSGVSKAWVEIIAGGGGGARSSQAVVTSGPSGGGGGGYAKKLVDLTGIKSVTITVGAGGQGAKQEGNTGGNGGTSSFGSIFWATGGAAGDMERSAPVGGHGTGGDENGTLGSGSFAIRLTANGTVHGGAGGGGVSPAAWEGGVRPQKPGNGGGGRVGSPAPDGADGQVSIKW